jgi:hypothetical protein
MDGIHGRRCIHGQTLDTGLSSQACIALEFTHLIVKDDFNHEQQYITLACDFQLSDHENVW